MAREKPQKKMHTLPDGAAALAELAGQVLAATKAADLQIATAESCTGGLLSSLLTDLDGFGRCFDRGFVVYTEEAKCDLLGIPAIEIARHGAVSAPIAEMMACGCLSGSKADLAVAITGYAGPAGPHEEGLVHVAGLARGGQRIARECHFGALGRDRVRVEAARAALEVLHEMLAAPSAGPA